jgi:hypothetical protein
MVWLARANWDPIASHEHPYLAVNSIVLPKPRDMPGIYDRIIFEMIS